MIRRIRPPLGWSLALAVVTTPASAQDTRTLTGTVGAAEEGVPFAGAEVRLIGTDVRTCANEKGDFWLPIPATGEALIRITPVGFEPREVRVAPGTSSVEVTLGEHLFILDEVEVVGYASSLDVARASGNSIARLTSADLQGAPVQSIEGAMQGKVAGAFIQANSGAPGGSYQIILRGINTILGSADPLVVVDGVVVSSAGPVSGDNAVTGADRMARGGAPANRLADINPGDVERIEVLRGPSASAMYGSRASNGVILITTKRGKAPTQEEVEAAEALQCFVPGAAFVTVR